MSAPQSVADTALGFTQSELLIFRHQQQLIAQQPGQRGAMIDRGRGTSRHSQPSSRAASAASSQSVPGRVVLDSHSLSTLGASLENLLANIRNRIEQLENAIQRSVQASADQQANTMQQADTEIERMKAVLLQIDHLEGECQKVIRIREIVRNLKLRVDAASSRLEKVTPSNHHHHHQQPPSRNAMTVSARSDPRRR